MPNVLHISRTMGQGGAEKVVEQLCADINDVRFVVASTGGYRVATIEKYGAKHYTIPDIDIKNPITMLRIFRQLNDIVKKEHIDIVHSHHRMAAFYARCLKFCHPTLKLVYTAHNIYTDKKLLTKFALQKTCIVACGQSVKANLTDFYQIPENKANLIINSIKIPKLKPNNVLPAKKRGQFFLATIGRLVYDKGIDILIEALNIINQQNTLDFQLFIIGDGEDRKILEQQIKQLNLGSRVHFLGFQKDPLSIVTSVDVAIAPSRREGLPLTIIELFSIGKPAIVSDINPHVELIDNTINGILFESDNSQDLAKQILDLARNTKLRLSIAKNAKKEYNIKYSYKTFIKKYKQIYYYA